MATGKRYVYGKQYLTETIPRLLEEMWVRLRAHEMCQGFWKRHYRTDIHQSPGDWLWLVAKALLGEQAPSLEEFAARADRRPGLIVCQAIQHFKPQELGLSLAWSLIRPLVDGILDEVPGAIDDPQREETAAQRIRTAMFRANRIIGGFEVPGTYSTTFQIRRYPKGAWEWATVKSDPVYGETSWHFVTEGPSGTYRCDYLLEIGYEKLPDETEIATYRAISPQPFKITVYERGTDGKDREKETVEVNRPHP